MKTFRVFRAEIQRLQSLYFGSIHAYSLAKDENRRCIYGQTDSGGPVVIHLKEFGDREVASNRYSFSDRLNRQYPRYLREVSAVTEPWL